MNRPGHRHPIFLAALLLAVAVWCLAGACAQAKALSIGAGAGQKNALWGFEMAASGILLPEHAGSPDFAREAGHYGYETAMGLAVWINRDPIGERGGRNLYGMVGNDAVDRLDKLGLDSSPTDVSPGPILPPTYHPPPQKGPLADDAAEMVGVKKWQCHLGFEVKGGALCPDGVEADGLGDSVDMACARAVANAESKVNKPLGIGNKCCSLGIETQRNTKEVIYPILFPPGIKPA